MVLYDVRYFVIMGDGDPWFRQKEWFFYAFVARQNIRDSTISYCHYYGRKRTLGGFASPASPGRTSRWSANDPGNCRRSALAPHSNLDALCFFRKQLGAACDGSVGADGSFCEFLPVRTQNVDEAGHSFLGDGAKRSLARFTCTSD